MEKANELGKLKLEINQENKSEEGALSKEEIRGCTHYKRKAKFVVSDYGNFKERIRIMQNYPEISLKFHFFSSSHFSLLLLLVVSTAILLFLHKCNTNLFVNVRLLILTFILEFEEDNF
jgi:hypothetical protein